MNRRSFMAALAATFVPAKATLPVKMIPKFPGPVPLWHPVKLGSCIGYRMDVHTFAASILFDIPPGKVTHDQRLMAKVRNFRRLYSSGRILPYDFETDSRFNGTR